MSSVLTLNGEVLVTSNGAPVTGDPAGTVIITDTLDSHGGTIRSIETSSNVTVVSPLSVTENGTYTAQSGHAYTPVTVNVSGSQEPNDVTFIDYDGTVCYSYSAAEFANLTAMPANPTHTGLTAQGWNWSLSDAKTYVATYGKLWIGQMYVTSSGKTEMDCEFVDGRTSPYLGLAVNGTVTVDWGDNSSTETITGTSLTTQILRPHNYSAPGSYTISIERTSSTGGYAFISTDSNLTCVPPLSNNGANGMYSFVYANAIKAVRFGNNITSIGQFGFYYCMNLSYVTIPNSITSIGAQAFRNCSLLSITIPNNATEIGLYAFGSCYSMLNASLSNSITSLGDGCFGSCSKLIGITIPSSVTSIGTQLCYNCYCMESSTIPGSITSLGNDIFRGCIHLKSVVIGDLLSLPQYIFNGCQTLKELTIPNSVTSIGAYAFTGCGGLAKLTIPGNVTSIDNRALFSVAGLAELHFKSASPPTLANEYTIYNIPTDFKIYVPTGSLSAYTSAANYPSSSTYTYIEE